MKRILLCFLLFSSGLNLCWADDSDEIGQLCEAARRDPDPCRLRVKESAYSELEKQACVEANRIRAEHGLEPMALHKKLQAFAKMKADEMIAQNRFHHDSGEFIARLQKAALIAAGPAENIAADQPTAKAVMQAWYNSQGHRENLLNPNSCVQGISAVYSQQKTQYKLYWVHEFARAVK